MKDSVTEEKSAAKPAAPALTVVYRGLLVLVFLLVLALLGGSLWAIFFRPGEKAVPAGERPEVEAEGTQSVFTGVGRLRLSTSDSLTVILSLNFPYPREDGPFSEELSSKVADFRKAAEEYFRRYKAAELKVKDEEEIKAELLERCNSFLRLGKIETLYFNDFMIIE